MLGQFTTANACRHPAVVILDNNLIDRVFNSGSSEAYSAPLYVYSPCRVVHTSLYDQAVLRIMDTDTQLCVG